MQLIAADESPRNYVSVQRCWGRASVLRCWRCCTKVSKCCVTLSTSRSRSRTSTVVDQRTAVVTLSRLQRTSLQRLSLYSMIHTIASGLYSVHVSAFYHDNTIESHFVLNKQWIICELQFLSTANYNEINVWMRYSTGISLMLGALQATFNKLLTIRPVSITTSAGKETHRSLLKMAHRVKT